MFMLMVDSFYDFIHKFKYCIQYIFIYFLLLLVLFLLVVPVLNIYPYIMFIIVIMGIIVAYCYKSKLLSLVLVSLWLSYISSYILYKYLYDGLALEDSLLIATLTLYFTIFISICTKISHNIEIKKPNRTLYPERELDLNLIITTIRKESVNILGIESFRGMGKSLILDHFMYREKDSFAFIRIDVVALNIDDVLEYLVMQITSELEKQYVFSKKTRNFISYINNFQYGSILNNFLGNESTYSSELENFKTSIRKLNKPIIIIFEDLDRIDDKDVLRKIFYISERLTADLSGKLKVIYQYSAEELNRKGFDNLYLQKYIPNNISLTHIKFMKLFDYILKNNSDEYKSVSAYRELILDIIRTIVRWDKYLISLINPCERDRYLLLTYNIRNVESFIRLVAFYINQYSEIIDKNKQFDEVLVKHCFIKCFLQNFYQTISTNIDIQGNFSIEIDNKMTFILDVIYLYRDYQVDSKNSIKLRQIFSPSINPINFEKLLAFCILKLYLYDNRLKDLFQSTRENIIQCNYNKLSSELEKDQKRSLMKLEHYFYFCVAIGNNAEENSISFVNRFVQEVLCSDDDNIIAYNSFINNNYKNGIAEDENFFSEIWKHIFDAFYYAAWNWEIEFINQYFDKLIQLYVKLYRKKYGNKGFSESLFKNLNIFLRSVLGYNLKSAFISMLHLLNYLDVNNCYLENKEFYIFQKRIIDILLNLEYIDTIDEELISEDIFKTEKFDINLFSKSYESILKRCKDYIDIFKQNNGKYDLEIYIKEVNIIKEFVDKIIILNNKDNFNSYDKDEDTKDSLNDEQLLLAEHLEEAINNNSIGVVRLCNALNGKY